MREYFHIKATERPRIFGMTASPIWNMKDPIGSLLALEANMNSIIIGVRENVDELAVHAPRPSEVHLEPNRSHSHSDLILLSRPIFIPHHRRHTIFMNQLYSSASQSSHIRPGTILKSRGLTW